MPKPKKRAYHSDLRQSQSQQTKQRILDAAKELFASTGFEKITIAEIARKAEVSTPAVYAIFQSKRGILRALIDEALPTEQFQGLVSQSMQEKDPRKRFQLTAKIARQLYDAEKTQLNFLRGASIIDPEFKELEMENERRRYDRQENSVTTMYKNKVFAEGLSLTKVRDIVWAFSGRDLYRMLVIERGWSSDEYEQWLAQLLIQALLK